MLAAAGIAGSVAFACTPLGSLRANGQADLAAAPGTVVRVEGSRFNVNDGAVRFTWNGTEGQALGIVHAPTVTTTANPLFPNTFTDSTTWTTEVTIPTNATPSSANGQNFIMAFQTKADGSLGINAMVNVVVTGPAATATQPDPVAPVQGNDETVTAPTATETQPTAAPSAATGAPAAAPATRSAAPAARTATAAPSSAAPSAAVATPAPAASASAPSAAPAAPASAVELLKPVAVPVANEIWSGLDKSAPALSLLDAPAPATSGSGFPAGAVLLGLGALALAGTVAVAGKQRLALARR